jgi:hypothetical protein
MRIEFVGPSYDVAARSFDVQRSINLYTVVSETGTSKSRFALRGTPGTSLFADCTDGPVRGSLSSTSGRACVVSGGGFYEIFEDGSETLRGSLTTQSGLVDIAENNASQIMVTDGIAGWIFTQTTNAWAQITDSDFPTPSSMTFQDGYFIVSQSGTQKFYISALSNGASWDALDFTSVESNPDNLVALLSDNGNLWCFGNRSVQVYQNTGAAAFPFEPIPGAIVQTGCAAAQTVRKFDGTITWLGTDEQGQGVVWKAEGYRAKRISTAAIEKKIAGAGDFSEAYSFVYHEQGHLFYCLQIQGLDTTLCYDASTGQWHERSYRNPENGERELHLAVTHLFFNKKNLVGSRIDGKIYEMSLDYFSDNGNPLVRERISPHQQGEKNLLTFRSFELDMEVGQGLQTGQGSDPQISLEYSNDGGFTWSNEIWRTFGRVGKYKQRVIWRQLGMARDRVFKVKISDPVFVQMNEAFVNAT